MSLITLSAIAIGSMVLSLATLTAALWIAGRCWRVPEPSWQRAALAALGINLGGAFLIAAVYLTPISANGHDGSLATVVKVVLAISLQLWLIIFCVVRAMRVNVGKGTGVGLTACVAASVVQVLFSFALRGALIEAFMVPTGSMAPTIQGVHYEIDCPHCGYSFAVRASDESRGTDGPKWFPCPNCTGAIRALGDSVPKSGDQILTDKRSAPERWDCAVYREPGGQNYVRRVVGMPGETLDIRDGDLIIDGHVMAKPPDAVLDAWLSVHDTHLVCRPDVDEPPRWRRSAGASHWQAGAERWTFKGLDASAESLEFQGEISDLCDYNALDPARRGIPVGDVRMECSIATISGTGSLALEWSYRGRHARMVQFADGGAGCVQSAPGDELLPEQATRATVERATSNDRSVAITQIVFAVRDGRAYVWCVRESTDTEPVGRELAAPAAGDDNMSPDDDPCRLRLVAEHAVVEITRIRLARDIYYLRPEEVGPGFQADTRGLPVALGANEFFVLGDNSRTSKDSRWTGPVPRQNLIGIARRRYWPPERWHTFR